MGKEKVDKDDDDGGQAGFQQLANTVNVISGGASTASKITRKLAL